MLVALLLVGAFAYVALVPFHGPIVLSLSEQHGVDLADLPALLLIVAAIAVHRSRVHGRGWVPGSRVVASAALALGLLLLAGIAAPKTGSPLTPAGGGTFAGDTELASGLHSLGVDRWSHLAVTYDGASIRLYVDGDEIRARPMSGTILRTASPLWIGGNRPYGEYFRGVIDDVRVYSRALRPAELRAEMSAPPGVRGERALMAAYEFDAADGRRADDVSGHANTGTISGASWTRSGRFGGGLRFDGAGEIVRVPASRTLDLTTAMTLTGWVRPSESQRGWRTVIARQKDAYTLMAGGGRANVARLQLLDRVRFGLVVLLATLFGFLIARADGSWAAGRRRWPKAIGLFVAGTLLDVAFSPSDTLIGPLLLAIWAGATAVSDAERVVMYALAGAFAAVTALALAHPAVLPVAADDGGGVRSAALGAMLVAGAALSLRGARARAGSSLASRSGR